MAVFCKKQLVRDEGTFQKRTLDTLIKNKEKIEYTSSQIKTSQDDIFDELFKELEI